jgi:diaminopimelate epimerase
MRKIPFFKMHGLGNDFVVLDERASPFPLDAAGVRALADRHTGIGCDQVIEMLPPRNPAAGLFMRIRNRDGSEAEACGNATRCLAYLLFRDGGERRIAIETAGGLLSAEVEAEDRITVDMGRAKTLWNEIPLSQAMDTLCVDLAEGPLRAPCCTNIGNPHATFFVADAVAVDLASLGPPLEHHPLFPEGANIGVASVAERGRIRLRVWERGAGLTRACGSAASAAVVAAHRRGLTGRAAAVALDGGMLQILWREDGHVLMTGPAVLSFEGSFDPALLPSER